MELQSSPTNRVLKRNLREQVVDELGQSIVSGQLKPGDFLPGEEILLARYRVSRTVLREALHVLSGKGILDARPKRGTLVRPRHDWNQLDPVVLEWQRALRGTSVAVDKRDALMEVRRIVEPAAAALAAARGTPEDDELITQAYQAMEKAGDSAEAFMESDLSFHTACLYAAKNDFLAPFANAIRSEMMASMRITGRDPEANRTEVLPLHKAILDAILARDPDSAAAAMKRHLDDTESRRIASTHKGD